MCEASENVESPTPGWRLLQGVPFCPTSHVSERPRHLVGWGARQGHRRWAGASSLIASPGSEPGGDNLEQSMAAWRQGSPALSPLPPLGTHNDHGRRAAPPRLLQADRKPTSFVLPTSHTGPSQFIPYLPSCHHLL